MPLLSENITHSHLYTSMDVRTSTYVHVCTGELLVSPSVFNGACTHAVSCQNTGTLDLIYNNVWWTTTEQRLSVQFISTIQALLPVLSAVVSIFPILPHATHYYLRIFHYIFFFTNVPHFHLTCRSISRSTFSNGCKQIQWNQSESTYFIHLRTQLGQFTAMDIFPQSITSDWFISYRRNVSTSCYIM